ncbi:MAG: hypothetical protein COA92_04275 [Sulfurovum sp.]|nr:MAG: hypothetical protein COA92_04275 [Sulfurovum sp.]
MQSKNIVIVFIFLAILGDSLYAETKIQNQDTIKSLISKVKASPPSKRRVLMNELKVKLRSMHKETRKQVMLELRHSFNRQNIPKHSPVIKSNMNHQNAMMMNESKNMKEYMNRDSMPTKDMQRPPGQKPPHQMPMRSK